MIIMIFKKYDIIMNDSNGKIYYYKIWMHFIYFFFIIIWLCSIIWKKNRNTKKKYIAKREHILIFA